MSNIPKQTNDSQRPVREFFDNYFNENLTFPGAEVDAVVGYFESRGFDRTSAESTAYVILAQAKIDNINSQELLDKLSGTTAAKLSEIITIILNANRYKSSRLGVRQTLVTKETVSRNILD